MTAPSEQGEDRSRTLRRRWLAAELKRLRGKRSREDAAKAIGLSGTAITRFETCVTPASEKHVKGLMDFYEASQEDRDRLIMLARDALLEDWWQPHEAAVPPHFAFFFGLETEASLIRTYEMGLVPGLLQTPEYYRAYLLTPPLAIQKDDVERLVAFRLERQKRYLAGGELHVILDESVILRPVGGYDVMDAQLAHIRQLATNHGNVTVQVLPFTAGAHHGMEGSFSVMTFRESLFDDVVYSENSIEGRYWEKADVVSRYNVIFEHLTHQALSTADSLDVLG